MNLLKTLYRRGTAVTILLIFLLAIAIALFATGFSAWSTACMQREQVDGQYTTIAVPVGTRSGDEWSDLFSAELEWSSILTQQGTVSCPGMLAEDCRGFLGAHVDGCTAVSFFDYEPGGTARVDFDDFNHSMVVLAVRCTEIKELEIPIKHSIYDENGERIGVENVGVECMYCAVCRLEDAVCRLDSYDVFPDDMIYLVYSKIYTPEGEIPFVEGKTYLLFGYPGDVVSSLEPGRSEEGELVWEFEEASDGFRYLYFEIDHTFGGGRQPYNYDEGNMLFSWEERHREGGERYYVLSEDSLPFCAEYTGDWEDFLQSDNGAVWREEILPLCRLNYESAGVILTDNIDSMYLFNTGAAGILEGRSFTALEYAAGENVCLVSAAYALKNGLTVGSVIGLDLYESDLYYRANMPSVWGNMEQILVQDPCMPDRRLGMKKDYTVVGIYTAPEFAYGRHNFQANTIFVPKRSVPEAERYENRTLPLLYSVILENGSREIFEEYLDSLGYGGRFQYFDQGYDAQADVLKVIAANAGRLLILGSTAFLLGGALFLYLSFRRIRVPARKMRLLGVCKAEVFREMVLVVGLQTAAGAVLGAAAGASLYRWVTRQALSESLTLPPQTFLLCIACESTVILAVAMVIAYRAAGENLMGSAKRGRKRP